MDRGHCWEWPIIADLSYSRAGRAASPPANTPVRGRFPLTSSTKSSRPRVRASLCPRCLAANRSRLLTPLLPAGKVDVSTAALRTASARVANPRSRSTRSPDLCAYGLRVRGNSALRGGSSSPSRPRRCAPALRHDPRKISFDTVRAYALPLYELGGRHALLQTARSIIPPNLSTLIARYPTIHQPTLLIWCAEDSVVPLWVGRRLSRALPNARLSVLRGCGHVPQEELPATTRSLIGAFVNR